VLADMLEGESLETVEETFEAFKALMQAKGEPLDDEREDLLGDATAFVGVGKYPARIKCALLGWMALKDALIQAQKEKA
jgi:nitrogen fixation NifU-like protein